MARKKIAIVGGGQIGGILALIATQKELGNIVLVDIPQKENLVKGKALDITALRPIDGVDVDLSGSSDFAAIAGADVVIITAGMPRKPGMTRRELLSVNLKIIENVAANVKQHAPNAFVVITTNPVDVISYAFHKLSGLPKQQVVGMAGVLDSARFCTFIAKETGLSVKDVSGLVIGEHSPNMMPLTGTATVGGVPLNALLSQAQIDAVVDRTRNAGTEVVNLYETGSAYFSAASATLDMVDAYLKDRKRVISSAALCEGEYGVEGLFLGVPAVIGAGGVERVLEFDLTEQEQIRLNETIAALKTVVAGVGF